MRRCGGSNDPSPVNNPSAFPENCIKVWRDHNALGFSNTAYKVTPTHMANNCVGQLTSLDSKALATPVQRACAFFPCSWLQMCVDHKSTENNRFGRNECEEKWWMRKNTRIGFCIWWESPAVQFCTFSLWCIHKSQKLHYHRKSLAFIPPHLSQTCINRAPPSQCRGGGMGGRFRGGYVTSECISNLDDEGGAHTKSCEPACHIILKCFEEKVVTLPNNTTMTSTQSGRMYIITVIGQHSVMTVIGSSC